MLGVLVLGETLSPLQVGGVLLVLGGVLIAGTARAVPGVPVVA